MRRIPQEPLFNSLLEQYHYLGYQQPVSEHLKYLVCVNGQAIACLALVFGATALSQPGSLHWLER